MLNGKLLPILLSVIKIKTELAHCTTFKIEFLFLEKKLHSIFYFLFSIYFKLLFLMNNPLLCEPTMEVVGVGWEHKLPSPMSTPTNQKK